MQTVAAVQLREQSTLEALQMEIHDFGLAPRVVPANYCLTSEVQGTEAQVRRLFEHTEAVLVKAAPLAPSVGGEQVFGVFMPAPPNRRDRSAVLRSISDDDLCADCKARRPGAGDMSTCSEGWPCVEDIDGYVLRCASLRT